MIGPHEGYSPPSCQRHYMKTGQIGCCDVDHGRVKLEYFLSNRFRESDAKAVSRSKGYGYGIVEEEKFAIVVRCYQVGIGWVTAVRC